MTASAIASMHSVMPRRTTTTMKDIHIPNPKYLPPVTGLTSFESTSIRVGLRAKTRPTETQDTTHRSSHASNVHPSVSGFNGRPLTIPGSNDARNYTTKRTGF
jgi:hypothetical protein